jgi:thiamine-phosphate pyrophosphorylase
MKTFDPTLYLVTDRRCCTKRTLTEVVGKAVDGGVTMVQLREKDLSPLEIREIAEALLTFLRPLKISLLINDYPQITKMVGADGVHLGASDMNISEARELLGDNFIIGVSIRSVWELERVSMDEIDYVAASPVFHTETKNDIDIPIGLSGLRLLRERCDCPLVAIGGVNVTNAKAVIQAGANGVAVISAILDAPDTRQSAAVLKRAILYG